MLSLMAFPRSAASALCGGCGLGSKAASAWRAISMIALRSSSLNLWALSKRAQTSAGRSAAAFCTACSASTIRSSGTRSKSCAVKASRTAIWAGTEIGESSGCFRQARMRWPWSMILRVCVIESRAEPGEGLEFLELRVGELEIAGDRAVGRPLRLAADPRDGFADIDRGQHAQLEQRRRQIDLAVGDGDQVGRNVGGNVLRLGLDDGQGGERAAAELLAEMGRALEHARMDVEDVAGKGLAPGRTAQQQGKLAIGAGVMGEIVVDDQHVAARFHEMLGDAGRGVGRDVGEPGRVVAFGRRRRPCSPSRPCRAGWRWPWPPRTRAGRWRNRRTRHPGRAG